MDDSAKAYDSDSMPVEHLLGTTVSQDDPDRQIIGPWAASVSGPILDVGSGTGRWTGHLTTLGHDVTGLEPAERLVRIAQAVHPTTPFRQGSITDLQDTEARWAGILAWYSIIHLNPADLLGALTTLRSVLITNGTMLMSFFAGAQQGTFAHPVATAYRWPMSTMERLLSGAGFAVTTHHWDPGTPHASVIAHRTD